MPVRDEVRQAQRSLARLDAAHVRAQAMLAQALTRRREVLADQDRLVAAAEAEVGRSVAAMAIAHGSELTAELLGIDAAVVRRLAKAHTPAPGAAGREHR